MPALLGSSRAAASPARALASSAGRASSGPPQPRRPAQSAAVPAAGPVLTSSFVTAPAAEAAAVPLDEGGANGSIAPALAKNNAAPLASPRYRVNVIKRSAWPDGVPPVMGGHLLASGVAAPLSVSKGAGIGVYPPVVPYPAASTFTADGAYPLSTIVHGSPGALAAALVAQVKAAAAEAITARGAFALAVSGGSVHSLLSALAKEAGPDAGKWTVVLADERAVPASSPHCNTAVAAGAWVDAARVGSLLPPTPADAALAADATRAAQAAAGALLAAPRAALPLAPHAGHGSALLPAFDLAILGIGNDGHVAGLFPNHPALAAAPSAPWVLPITRPSPTPPHVPRWTLSLPVLNAAKKAIIVAAGPHKASAVARSLETQALPGSAPAQLLRPAGGVTWMVDADAGSQLVFKWGDAKTWPRNDVGGGK